MSAGSINYTVCKTISTNWFCILEKVESNLDLDFKAEYTEKSAISSLSIKLVATAIQNRKMSFCLRTNKSFFSLLGTSKILSLGEFDELKSHLFSVHFSD